MGKPALNATVTKDMRSTVLLLLLLAAAGCQPLETRKQRPTFPERVEHAAPARLHVISIGNLASVQVHGSETKGSVILGALAGGVAGAVVASLVENANNAENRTNAELAEQILDRRLTEVDFAGYMNSVYEDLESESRWQLTAHTGVVGADDLQVALSNALALPGTTHVVVLSGSLELGDSFEQLQVGLSQSVFSSTSDRDEAGDLVPDLEKDFVVYTRKRALDFRPMTDHERAELAAVIRAQAEEALQDESSDRTRVALKTQKQLGELEETRLIPVIKAFEERWTLDTVEATLQEAHPVLRTMLRLDWNETRTLAFPDTGIPRFSVEIDGERRIRRGIELARTNGYIILVDERGDMAAIPETR